jgi:hypothetical protein
VKNRTEAEKKRCLIIGPNCEEQPELREHSDKVRNIIEHAVKDDYKSQDAYRLPDPGPVFEAVLQRLLNDDLVVADLTGADPNVYFEVAIRHAVGKPIVSFYDRNYTGKELPSVLRGIGVVLPGADAYDTEEAIRAKVKETETQGYNPRFPVTEAFDQIVKERTVLEYGTPLDKLMTEFIQFAQGKLGGQLSAMDELVRDLRDSTRKPLHGIDEVFAHIYFMLKNTKPGGRLWFVGMTFGMGPPHRYRVRPTSAKKDVPESLPKTATKADDVAITIDRVLHGKWKDLPPFDEMILELHEMLGSVIEEAIDPVLVCLKHDKKVLMENFLSKLAKRTSYQTLLAQLDAVADEIMSLHNAVAKKAKGTKPIVYADSIPLQILIVEKNDPSPLAFGKKACVVFHVGTGNIETTLMEDGETGFYTELDSLVEMFQTMAESLWEAGQVGPAPQ